MGGYIASINALLHNVRLVATERRMVLSIFVSLESFELVFHSTDSRQPINF